MTRHGVFAIFGLVKFGFIGRLAGLCYESRYTSELSRVGISLRLRQRDHDALHQVRRAAGHLQRVPSVLHGHVEVLGHGRARGQVPAAHGQDAGRPGRRRDQEEKEVAGFPFLRPPSRTRGSAGGVFFMHEHSTRRADAISCFTFDSCIRATGTPALTRPSPPGEGETARDQVLAQIISTPNGSR
jgi:hypothetical protein